MHVYTDPATLPLDQRAMFEAEPMWVTTAMGVASLAGVAGAVMLLLRRKAAVPLMIVSLICVLLWFAGLFAAPSLRDVLSTDDIAVGGRGRRSHLDDLLVSRAIRASGVAALAPRR